MSYFTLRDGEKLYYEDKGEGPETLVMMHGWTSSHDIYLELQFFICIITLEKRFNHEPYGSKK